MTSARRSGTFSEQKQPDININDAGGEKSETNASSTLRSKASNEHHLRNVS